MKRIVCAVLSGILVMGSVGYGGMVSYGAPSYSEANAVGPGIKAAVGLNDFLDQEVSDPIVKPADKYSYDQMEADIQSLKNRYGDKITVNIIGT